MIVVASSLIDWSSLWKIVVAALIGGTGVVIVFGFLLLGLKHAREAKNSGSRATAYAVSGICGVACVGVAVVGIYAMAQKPSSSKKPAKAKSALVIAPRAANSSGRPESAG